MTIRRFTTAFLFLVGALPSGLGTTSHLAGQSPVRMGDVVRFSPPGETRVVGSVDRVAGDMLRLALVTVDGSELYREFPAASVLGLERHGTRFNYAAFLWTAGGSALLGGLLMRNMEDEGFLFADDSSQFALGAFLGGTLGLLAGFVVGESQRRDTWTPTTLPRGSRRSVGLDFQLLASPARGRPSPQCDEEDGEGDPQPDCGRRSSVIEGGCVGDAQAECKAHPEEDQEDIQEPPRRRDVRRVSAPLLP